MDKTRGGGSGRRGFCVLPAPSQGASSPSKSLQEVDSLPCHRGNLGAGQGGSTKGKEGPGVWVEGIKREKLNRPCSWAKSKVAVPSPWLQHLPERLLLACSPGRCPALSLTLENDGGRNEYRRWANPLMFLQQTRKEPDPELWRRRSPGEGFPRLSLLLPLICSTPCAQSAGSVGLWPTGNTRPTIAG